MARTRIEYIVIAEIDHKKIPPNVLPAFSKLKIGDKFTPKSLFDKYRHEIDIASDHYAMTQISRASRIACQENMLERIQTLSAPRWFRDLETISFWQSQLRGRKFKNRHASNIASTRSQYLYNLWCFNKWLSGKEFPVRDLRPDRDGRYVDVKETIKFENVQDMVRILERPYVIGKDVAKIIKMYLMDGMHDHKKATSMQGLRNSIMSYFVKNDCDIKVRYDPKATHSTEAAEQEMTFPDLMSLLTTGKPTVTEKAVFLCKFHRGLDSSTLVDRFNYEAWEQLVKWFGGTDYNFWSMEKCPVPISLIRMKTDYKHTGYLDRDAITSLKPYLDYRKEKTGSEMQKDDALFLNKYGNPISVEWMSASFHRVAARSGVQKYSMINGRKSYKMDLHEMRDLLKSTLLVSGCRRDVAEHVIGHKPRDSYEKQATLYPEDMRIEYAKASKKINIFTAFESVVTKSGDPNSLEIKLNEALLAQKRMSDDITLRDAAMKRHEDVFKEYQRQVDIAQNQIRELQDQLSGQTKDDTLES